MTKVYTCFVHPLEDEAYFDLLPLLDDHVREKIHRFRKKEDQTRTLLAHALSKVMLAKELQVDSSKLSYSVNEFGKYELKAEQLYFNLSHSKDYVVCAISKKQVGIDIEKRLPRDFQLFATIWSEEERIQYDLCDNLSFYRLWTAKESYVKYLGIGLNASLEKISVRKDASIIDQQCLAKSHIEYVNVNEDYVCAVCSEERVESVVEISIEEIISFYRRDEYSENY